VPIEARRNEIRLAPTVRRATSQNTSKPGLDGVIAIAAGALPQQPGARAGAVARPAWNGSPQAFNAWRL